MKVKIKKFGNSLHIPLKKTDGFKEGQEIEIIIPNSDKLSEDLRKIIREEIEAYISTQRGY